jgi:ABC-2 type transport system ATP-binding protein
MPTMIEINDLWEEFTITTDRTRSLKEVLARLQITRGKRSVMALKGISLQVEAGTTVGLIGENGSGKSTLLRCIAGILVPTKGEVLVGGTVASLIELGVGFDPDLPGRENALVNSVLFGLTRRQFEERFDSIVEFAELEAVIDQPMRSFSSGMNVRMAFSIATHVDSDILLIDEVLAVGDESFQRKCMRKIEELHASGVTVVFVSHELPLVKRICERCILIDGGTIAADGDSEDIISRYLEQEDLREGLARQTHEP